MNSRWPDLVLRAGLAFAFLYPPIDSLFDPYAWIGYFPPHLRLAAQAGGIPDLVLLHGFGFVEVVIALWLLSGRQVFWPASAALIILLGIVAVDSGAFQVVFRDLSIASIALALAIRSYPHAFARRVPGA